MLANAAHRVNVAERFPLIHTHSIVDKKQKINNKKKLLMELSTLDIQMKIWLNLIYNKKKNKLVFFSSAGNVLSISLFILMWKKLLNL